MSRDECIKLLRINDRNAVEFCANYLSTAWDETLEEAHEGVVHPAWMEGGWESMG